MRTLLSLLAAALIVTALFGTIYVVAQQIERLGANDAPQRLASQVANELDFGHPVAELSLGHVDISESDAAFFDVYNTRGVPSAGTGYLHGGLAHFPTGPLQAAIANGSNRVTWQDASGRRFATVEWKAGDRVVVAGQSLTPTEERINSIGLIVLLAWAGSIAVLIAVGVIIWKLAGTRTP